MITLIVKLFGGRVRSAVASCAVWLALWAVAQLMKLDPHLALLVDPDKLATFLTAAFFTSINLITNDDHLSANSALNQLLTGIASGPIPTPEIQVKKAIIIQ